MGEGAESAGEVVIQLRDVAKSYDSAAGEVPVLRGVTLDVAAGQTVVLQGVSGSGKSTLLHLLAAIDRASAGSVTVCGTSLGRLARREEAAFRARRIGFVFQFFNLMPTLTAAENVGTGLEPLRLARREREERALAALAAVGLGDQARRFPAQLSGGQQQRVAIARAMAKRPPVILADEPTGALDEATARQVMGCLIDMQAETGCALVIATHDPVVCEYAGRLYRLSSGRIEPG